MFAFDIWNDYQIKTSGTVTTFNHNSAPYEHFDIVSIIYSKYELWFLYKLSYITIYKLSESKFKREIFFEFAPWCTLPASFPSFTFLPFTMKIQKQFLPFYTKTNEF